MNRTFVRWAGAAALVTTLGLGTTAETFAAASPAAPAAPVASGAEADTPDTLPAGSISQAQAQQDALKSYPGGTAVADGVNDSNGTITYGFTVTQNGTTYDVQVDALKGTVVQADAAGSDGPGATGGDTAQETGAGANVSVGGSAGGADAFETGSVDAGATNG